MNASIKTIAVNDYPLCCLGVKVYGAGIGANLNESKMRSIVSTPPEYYYHRTTDWLDILKKGLMEKRNGESVCLSTLKDPFRKRMENSFGVCMVLVSEFAFLIFRLLKTADLG